jgi:uncharacterized protein YcbX
MWLAQVKVIRIYPLKSAQGVSVAHARVEASGLADDRSWMLVDSRGRFLTQRTLPRLAALPVRADSQSLQLGPVAQQPLLTVSKPQTLAARRYVEVWQHFGEALDAGDAAAHWCSEFLQQEVRLVYHGGVLNRIANPKYTADEQVPVLFADGYPVLVTNQASLDDLAQRMGASLTMNAFRPNVVLGGLPPWVEDRIGRVDIGPVSLRLCKPCTRCVIPSIDQITGLAAPDPTPTLKQFRYDTQLRGVTFGENAYAMRGIGELLTVGAAARCHPR